MLRATLAEVLTAQANLCMDDFMSRSSGGSALIKQKDTSQLISTALTQLEEALETLQHLVTFEADEAEAGSSLAPALRDTAASQDHTDAAARAGARARMDPTNIFCQPKLTNPEEMLSQLELTDFTADILMCLVDVKIASGSWRAAHADCNRALRVRRRIYGDCSVHVALCHEKLGEVYEGLVCAELREIAESGARVEVCVFVCACACARAKHVTTFKTVSNCLLAKTLTCQ